MKKLLITLFSVILLISCASINEKNISTDKRRYLFGKETSLIGAFNVENMEDEKLVNSKEIIDNKKTTLLIMATEWCPYCRNEFPDIEKFYSEYRGKVDVILIYSNDRTTKEKVRLYDFSNSFSFKRYFDRNNEAYISFGIKKYPSNYILKNVEFIKLDNPLTYEKLVELFSK